MERRGWGGRFSAAIWRRGRTHRRMRQRATHLQVGLSLRQDVHVGKLLVPDLSYTRRNDQAAFPYWRRRKAGAPRGRDADPPADQRLTADMRRGVRPHVALAAERWSGMERTGSRTGARNPWDRGRSSSSCAALAKIAVESLILACRGQGRAGLVGVSWRVRRATAKRGLQASGRCVGSRM
jgi:hypothetical protein